MKTLGKIESYFNMIEGIRYDNPNGGAYAYVQYLAYSRELLRMLKAFKKMDRHIEKLEAVNWLFNEYLAVKFTPRQQSIFESKLSEVKDTFDAIRYTIAQLEKDYPVSGVLIHKAAA